MVKIKLRGEFSVKISPHLEGSSFSVRWRKSVDTVANQVISELSSSFEMQKLSHPAVYGVQIKLSGSRDELIELLVERIKHYGLSAYLEESRDWPSLLLQNDDPK